MSIVKKIENVTELSVTVADSLGVVTIKHVRDPSKATFQIIVRATTKNFNPLNEEENEAVIKRIGDELKVVVKQALKDRFEDLQALDRRNPDQLEIGFLNEVETAHVEYDVPDEEEVLIGDAKRAANRPKGKRQAG